MSPGISIRFYDCKPWAEPITRFGTLVLNNLFIFQNEFWQIIIYFSIFFTHTHIYNLFDIYIWHKWMHMNIFSFIFIYINWLLYFLVMLHALFLGYTFIYFCFHKMIRSNHIINDVTTTNNCTTWLVMSFINGITSNLQLLCFALITCRQILKWQTLQFINNGSPKTSFKSM
jgi:hypothetical protein